MSLFWTPDDAATIVETPLEIITSGTENKGNGIYLLKAGTPLDEYFAVSNDEDAVYLVAEDFYFYSNTPTQPKIVPLITAGYVDLNKAEAASGLTYTDDCIAALEEAGITLVDGKLATGGGGGSSSGASVYNVYVLETDEDTFEFTNDSTYAALLAAYTTDDPALPVLTVYSLSGANGVYYLDFAELEDESWVFYFQRIRAGTQPYADLIIIEPDLISPLRIPMFSE